MVNKKLITYLLISLTMTTWLQADVKPSSVFGDHMVVQREMPVPVWGTASPAKTITVEFAGQLKSCQAATDGKWTVKLDPLNALSGIHLIQGNNYGNLISF